MSHFEAHPLFPLVLRLKRYHEAISFEPGRIPSARDLRRLLLECDGITITPGLEKEDTAIRQALSMLIRDLIQLCRTHLHFEDEFNVSIKIGIDQIDRAIEKARRSQGAPDVPRYRSNHPPWVNSYLKRWLFTHRSNPYPSDDERQELVTVTGLRSGQISDWFVRALSLSLIATPGLFITTND